MGIVNGWVSTPEYIKRVFKERGLSHCLRDYDLDVISKEELGELHEIAVREENAWIRTVIDILNVIKFRSE